MVRFLLVKSPQESKPLAPAMCAIFYDPPIVLNVGSGTCCLVWKTLHSAWRGLSIDLIGLRNTRLTVSTSSGPLPAPPGHQTLTHARCHKRRQAAVPAPLHSRHVPARRRTQLHKGSPPPRPTTIKPKVSAVACIVRTRKAY